MERTRSIKEEKMRKASILLTASAVALLLAGAALAGERKSNPAWERMKSLQGDWEGTYAGKEGAKISYRLISSGTALMETMDVPGEMDMVTVYHPDGDRVLATHYCSAGNQPRMRSQGGGGDSDRLLFGFVDVTNLSSPDDLHMKKLAVTFQGKDRFSQEWTSSVKGKEETGRFEFTRKK
jgi:hypothetical protein